MTHTPGPWTVSENAYGAVFVHGGETLTSFVGTEYKELITGGNSHNTLTLANARLIAAAPELLSALKDLIDDLEIRSTKGVVNCSHGVYCNARQAVAKAEAQP